MLMALPILIHLHTNSPCMTTRFLLALLLGGTLLRAASPSEENWPAWRGPFATGVSPTANPPTVWSETNNIRWKVKIPGSGLATPIIWGNQIFIQTAIPRGRKDAPEKVNPAVATSPGADSPPPPTNAT